MRTWLSCLVALLGLGLVCARAHASQPSPACVPLKLNVSAALAGGRVTVSPEPDSEDASGATQVSFLGVPATAITGVRVVGSHTGAHVGSLRAFSQGDGASFVSAHPFSAGERVTVSATLDQAGQATPFSWSFVVTVPDVTHTAAASTPPPAPRADEYQRFLSRPDLKPPTVTITRHTPGTASGDLFLGPYGGPGQYGPMILDENGGLLWFKALPNQDRTADFRVQQYEGKPVLTWWQDPVTIGGRATAGLVIADSSYRTIATMRAGNGYQPDLHEFQITPQGTALVTIYNAIDCDESSAGGPRNGAVADSIMQEIDLRTGLVRYEWHSLDHVPLSDSHSSAATTSRAIPFDFFHINSIDIEQDGSLLLDARNTWAAYDIDRRSGQVRWQLGGRHSSFKMGPGTIVAWQHDARQQPDGTISFFDNGATPRVHPQTRTVVLALDMQRKTVSLVRRYEHPTPILAGSQGNMQALSDGSWLVGWGQSPYFSEFSASGQLLLDGHMAKGYTSYRAYRLAWRGQPTGGPSLAARRGAHGGIEVLASWNGATAVAGWRVLEGGSSTSLRAVAQAARSGFESAISSPGAGAYVAVQALDGGGAVLGTSATVAMKSVLR